MVFKLTNYSRPFCYHKIISSGLIVALHPYSPLLAKYLIKLNLPLILHYLMIVTLLPTQCIKGKILGLSLPRQSNCFLMKTFIAQKVSLVASRRHLLPHKNQIVASGRHVLPKKPVYCLIFTFTSLEKSYCCLRKTSAAQKVSLLPQETLATPESQTAASRSHSLPHKGNLLPQIDKSQSLAASNYNSARIWSCSKKDRRIG